ncbi:MAG TPA: PLD nuclease N-terminal domain-containing protein [Acidimicrobiales bacterium]
MPFALGVIVLLWVFWFWAIADVITTPETAARNLPKVAWVFVVLFLNALGAFAWLALGRPHSGSLAPGGATVRPLRGKAARERWHPALDERVDNHETERERAERERREYLRRMDDELDRRLEQRQREQAEGPDPT